MKTKNNVRKAAIKSIATATGLMLIGLTVNAQMSSYFENAGNNTMAMITEKTVTSAFATTVNTKALAATDVLAIYLFNETEEPLQLEDWMLKENNFSTSDTVTVVLINGQEVVGRFVANNLSGLSLRQPLTLVMSPQGAVFQQFTVTGDTDNTVVIRQHAVSAVVKTNSEIASAYTNATSGIVMPEKSSLLI